VAELIERAQAFLKNPPAKKLSADELAALKKAQKAPPPPTLEQMLAHADTRVAELTAEIAHAPTPTEKERFEGAMIGLAIGDALGGPTEFMSREELRAKHGKVTDMIGGGWLNLKPGRVHRRHADGRAYGPRDRREGRLRSGGHRQGVRGLARHRPQGTSAASRAKPWSSRGWVCPPSKPARSRG
jgi:hypothetical protein